jgi:hypothetical protein
MPITINECKECGETDDIQAVQVTTLTATYPALACMNCNQAIFVAEAEFEILAAIWNEENKLRSKRSAVDND